MRCGPAVEYRHAESIVMTVQDPRNIGGFEEEVRAARLGSGEEEEEEPDEDGCCLRNTCRQWPTSGGLGLRERQRLAAKSLLLAAHKRFDPPSPSTA